MKLSDGIALFFVVCVAGLFFIYFDLAGVHREKPEKIKVATQPAEFELDWKDMFKEPYRSRLTQGIEGLQITFAAGFAEWTNMIFSFDDRFAIRIDNWDAASNACLVMMSLSTWSPTNGTPVFHFNLVPK